MNLLNFYRPVRRYSYPLTSSLIVLALTYFLLVKRFSVLGLCIVVGGASLLFFLWAWQRPGTSRVSRSEEVVTAIGDGRPTFLNVYSNY